MTDEQKKLVEDNHSMIYLVIRDMGLPIEDNYDIAAIGLCKAAMNYDPKKYSFSTFAYRCIKNEIMLDFRARNMPKRALNENLISYDAPALSQYDGEKLSLLDQIRSSESVENEAISRIMYDELVEQLGATDRKVLTFFERGLKQNEIAKIMGTSQANVSRVKRRVENILCCD